MECKRWFQAFKAVIEERMSEIPVQPAGATTQLPHQSSERHSKDNRPDDAYSSSDHGDKTQETHGTTVVHHTQGVGPTTAVSTSHSSGMATSSSRTSSDSSDASASMSRQRNASSSSRARHGPNAAHVRQPHKPKAPSPLASRSPILSSAEEEIPEAHEALPPHVLRAKLTLDEQPSPQIVLLPTRVGSLEGEAMLLYHVSSQGCLEETTALSSPKPLYLYASPKPPMPEDVTVLSVPSGPHHSIYVCLPRHVATSATSFCVPLTLSELPNMRTASMPPPPPQGTDVVAQDADTAPLVTYVPPSHTQGVSLFEGYLMKQCEKYKVTTPSSHQYRTTLMPLP